MDPELEELKRMMRQNLELSAENNRLLHSMRSSARWALAWRVIYFLIIFGGLTFGYVYFLQPYVEQLLKAYEQLQGIQGTAAAQMDTSGLNSIIDSLKGYLPTGGK